MLCPANAASKPASKPLQAHPSSGGGRSVSASATASASGGNWEQRFLAVQVHRLVWWGAEGDVDAGVVSGSDI